MRPAFTLVELLVVIAIISALATMTIPSINLIKERSRGSQCISNMTQFSAGIAKYSTDWNGRIPGLNLLHAKNGSISLFDNYMGVSYQNVQDQKNPFLKCPAFFRIAAEYKGSIASARQYRANGHLNQYGNHAVDSGGPLFVTISMLNPQAALLFCADGKYGATTVDGSVTTEGCQTGGIADTWDRIPQFPHRPSKPPYVGSFANYPMWYSGQTNVLHIDGHISTLSAGPVDAGNPWGLGIITKSSAAGTDYDDSKYVPLTSGFTGGQPNGLSSQSGKDKFNAFWWGQLR